MWSTTLPVLLSVFSVANEALAIDIVAPVDEIGGQRILLTNSGRKYASCYGRDFDTRLRTEREVSRITIRGDYLESLLDDGIIYGLAIRGYIGHSGEVTVGLDPLEDSASISTEVSVDITIEFAGRTFAATLSPELYCTATTEDGVMATVGRGESLLDESGIVACGSTDVFFTLTTLDSMLQALEVEPDALPDMVVTVDASFEATYTCTGHYTSLAIGRSEIMTPWLTVFNMNEAICL
jgi:hypothetical protein